ncbi:MAG: HlyC/CorC family transporter [Oscillospiraceae bacterium]|nr:HlyC/CorC family transporter [Oscillospiraceae bacterium]
MDNSVLFTLALQVVLIALNAVFACAEIAVISMNDNKLAKMAAEGDKRAVRLARLTSQPARFLATIQVAITLSGFLGSAFAAENFSGVLVDWLLGLGVPMSAEVLDSIAVVFITIVLSYFTLVFGELVPKQVAMRNAEKLALGMSGLISGISKVFAPLVGLLTLSTNGVLRLMRIDPNAQEEEVGEEEIRMMVDVGNEKGTIDNEEREFIQNVFEFDNLPVVEIITHRTDVTFLYLEDSLDVWHQTIVDTRYTYYPICDETPDRIVGVLNSKIYFRLPEKTKETVMEQAVLGAYVVPESLKADVLFRNMKKEHEQFAVVLDEYGGMSGIVTIKDLIEELVGDLEDDVLPEETVEKIICLEENTWQAEGGVLLEELSEKLDMALESQEYDTLNGLVFHHLGTSPEVDSKVELDGLEILVTKMHNYQVETAIIRKTATAEPAEVQ